MSLCAPVKVTSSAALEIQYLKERFGLLLWFCSCMHRLSCAHTQHNFRYWAYLKKKKPLPINSCGVSQLQRGANCSVGPGANKHISLPLCYSLGVCVLNSGQMHTQPSHMVQRGCLFWGFIVKEFWKKCDKYIFIYKNAKLISASCPFKSKDTETRPSTSCLVWAWKSSSCQMLFQLLEFYLGITWSWINTYFYHVFIHLW